MLTITDSARAELEAFFADKSREDIRIYLIHGGCGGPRLALALDAAREDDRTFKQSGFSFCINGELLEKVEAVTVDLNGQGFAVQPQIPLAPADDSACSCCSGGCGR